MQKTTIDGYTLYGCYGAEKGADNFIKIKKNFCTDKNSLKQVIEKAKTIKINFDKNKKLIKYSYKTKNDFYVSDFFVVDDKKKEIYLQANYAYFEHSLEKKVAPQAVSSPKYNYYCLYEEGAMFGSVGFGEDLIPSSKVYIYDDGKPNYVCVSFNYDKSKNPELMFTEGYLVFYDDYKGTDIEAFVNKVSK